MILLLNLSVEPFFVAFVADEKVVEQKEVPNTRDSGTVLFEFLQKHKSKLDQITWVGTISGPGGFATLRVCASVCNVLAYHFGIGIRQVRADKWVRPWALSQGYKGFILNSFGSKVFVSTEQGIEVQEIETVASDGMWFDALSEKKKEFLNTNINQESISVESLYAVLKEVEEQKVFVPEYMYGAVS